MGSWAVLDDIYEDRTFSFDRLMQALPATSEFGKDLSQRQLIQLGRRTLEVAIWRAIGDQTDLSEARKDWQEVRRLALSAQAHLVAFLNNLAPPLTGADWNEQQALWTPLRLLATNDSATSDAQTWLSERELSVRQQSEALTGARRALERIAEGAAARDKFVASQNGNEGARDQNEFVRTFSEAWGAITGTLPPTSRNKTLFLNLLYAAWSDAGQDSTANFTRSIARARTNIERELPTLSVTGPEWL